MDTEPCGVHEEDRYGEDINDRTEDFDEKDGRIKKIRIAQLALDQVHSQVNSTQGGVASETSLPPEKLAEIQDDAVYLDRYSGIKEMSLEATPAREMFVERDFERFGTLTR